MEFHGHQDYECWNIGGDMRTVDIRGICDMMKTYGLVRCGVVGFGTVGSGMVRFGSAPCEKGAAGCPLVG